jgi:hypothetical protein
MFFFEVAKLLQLLVGFFIQLEQRIKRLYQKYTKAAVNLDF